MVSKEANDTYDWAYYINGTISLTLLVLYLFLNKTKILS